MSETLTLTPIAANQVALLLVWAESNPDKVSPVSIRARKVSVGVRVSALVSVLVLVSVR